MVVCRYFQQGNCRFGENCRFEHYDDNYGQNYSTSRTGQSILLKNNSSNVDDGSESIFRSSAFVNVQYPVQPSVNNVGLNLKDIIQSVRQDVIQSSKGQWPLSCYSPSKGAHNFPGMIDYSFEEIRWNIYESKLKGVLPDCLQQIDELQRNAKLRKEDLFNPSNWTLEILQKIFSGEKIDDSTTCANLTSSVNNGNFPTTNNDNNNVCNYSFSLPSFQGSVNTNTIFGGSTAPQTSIFTQQYNKFGTENSFNVNNQNFDKSESENPMEFNNTSAVECPVQLPRQITPFSFAMKDKSVETVYSLMSNLSDDEKNAFKAQTFSMGLVPIKPPPKEFVRN